MLLIYLNFLFPSPSVAAYWQSCFCLSVSRSVFLVEKGEQCRRWWFTLELGSVESETDIFSCDDDQTAALVWTQFPACCTRNQGRDSVAVDFPLTHGQQKESASPLKLLPHVDSICKPWKTIVIANNARITDLCTSKLNTIIVFKCFGKDSLSDKAING